MKLSNKLIADYIELIDYELATFKIELPEDFESIKKALENIIEPVEGYSLPEKYREKISSINDYLQFPEDYVEYEENYVEYKQIVRERISKKIVEIDALNDEQKIMHIRDQQKQKAFIEEQQILMASRKPPQPGSAAHVLSQQEALREMQQRFETEPEIPSR